MAPEVVKQTGHSSKADVWSVGCLVVEMLTGSHPWPDLNQLQAMYQVRPSFPLLSKTNCRSVNTQPQPYQMISPPKPLNSSIRHSTSTILLDLPPLNYFNIHSVWMNRMIWRSHKRQLRLLWLLRLLLGIHLLCSRSVLLLRLGKAFDCTSTLQCCLLVIIHVDSVYIVQP
jgi:serine/threonine protein kinase